MKKKPKRQPPPEVPVPSGDSAFDAVPRSWHQLEGAALEALDLINKSMISKAHATLLEALDDVDWERRIYEGLEGGS